jgi:hypothetical protein
MEYADKETQEKLTEAINLLCEHVKRRLVAGWEIRLRMDGSEASIELLNPDGESVDVYADRGISAIDEACVTAFEHETDDPQ